MAFRLRLATLADCDQILSIYQHYVLNTLATTEVEPIDKQTFRGRMSTIMTDYPYVVIEDDGNILAYSYASRQRERPGYNWNVELSIYVAPGNARQNFGRTLYETVMTILTAQHVQNVYALVTEGNEASHILHKNLGFVHIGFFEKSAYKQGAWLDITHYHKRLVPMQKPQPFISIHDVEPLVIANACEWATEQLQNAKEND